LALVRRNRAQHLVRSWCSREAYDDALESLREFDELLAASPTIPRYLAGEAACSLTFGQVLRDVDEDELARVAIAKAIQNFSELAQAIPEDGQYITHQAVSYTGLGRLLEKDGDTDAARDAFRTSIELRAAQPDKDPYAQDALAWSYARLADNLHGHGEDAPAADYYDKCMTLLERLTELPPQLYNLAWFLTHCRDENRRDPDRAAEIARQLIERVPQNANYHHLLGVAEFRVEKRGDAVAAMQEAASLRARRTASDGLYMQGHRIKVWINDSLLAFL
jgi:tetratricopeptide (TPR) repeat protein